MKQLSHFCARTSVCLVPCLLVCCAPVNHYAIHPRVAPSSIQTWSEETDCGPLHIHLEWAAPIGTTALPTVLVHPEAGSVAADMRGIVLDLAVHGYRAAAVDYQRLVGGRYRRTLFPWREPGDPMLVMNVLRRHPEVDADRIGLLGFSQGGVFSLLIAAQDPRVKAAVAYYPVTDFPRWLNDPDYGWGRRFVFRFVRRHFRSESGARSDQEFAGILEQASPLRQAQSITAPVLLIHGVKDATAPVDQSRLLAQTLAAMGRSVSLVEIEGAGHVFNFYDRYTAQARTAWETVLAFFDRYLRTADVPRTK